MFNARGTRNNHQLRGVGDPKAAGSTEHRRIVASDSARRPIRVVDMASVQRRGELQPSARHSLGVRLPVLISVLIAAVVVTFLWTARGEVETTLMREGGARAQTAATQIASLIQQPSP